MDVLIGKPDTAEVGGKIETLLEQLRLRQLSIEQIETYERQRAAAEKLRTLNDAQAIANMQTSLTNSSVQVQIAENQGEADLARARKAAEQLVVTAQAESRQRVLAGRGEGSRVLQIGLSEAAVLLRKIGSFGDPRLYALQLVAEQLSHASQPLVPERVFLSGRRGWAADNTVERYARHVDPTAGRGEIGLHAGAEAAAMDSLEGVHRPHDARSDGVDAASRAAVKPASRAGTTAAGERSDSASELFSVGKAGTLRRERLTRRRFPFCRLCRWAWIFHPINLRESPARVSGSAPLSRLLERRPLMPSSRHSPWP